MQGTTRGVLGAAALVLAGALLVAGCGDDDTDTSAGEQSTDGDGDAGTADGGGTDVEDSDDTGTDDGDDGPAASSGGGGTLVFAGEEISLDSSRCFLEEQPAAAGGGSILATAQGQGTNAGGETVRLDFSRYSEDSMFAGDDVIIDIGPLAESTSFSGGQPEGTVSIEGDVVSATDFPVTGEQLEEVQISFEIDCG